jgi:ankyrin repeat protein
MMKTPIHGHKRKLKLKLNPPIKDVINPVEYLRSTFDEFGLKIESTSEKTYFLQPTSEMIEAYDKEVLKAVREKSLEKIKEFHKEGKVLQCCNRFGESLIHMACRNGLTDMVKFLVKEAKVSLYVRDDYGRTPLHDACWTVTPNFDLMDFLIAEAPELLALSDVRGHLPLAYVRKNHWSDWVDFLSRRKDLLRSCNRIPSHCT